MSKKILLLDNYDSFTYNVDALIKKVSAAEVSVIRNDKLTLHDVNAFDTIVFSPGPGLPSEAGLMPRIIAEFQSSKKMLGICLGHQCIGEVFGSELSNLSNVIHGKALPMKIVKKDSPLFKDIPETYPVGRYHSWVVNKDKLGGEIEVLAIDDEGEVMALRHKSLPIYGVQFHPESVLTEHGEALMRNFLTLKP